MISHFVLENRTPLQFFIYLEFYSQITAWQLWWHAQTPPDGSCIWFYSKYLQSSAAEILRMRWGDLKKIQVSFLFLGGKIELKSIYYYWKKVREKIKVGECILIEMKWEFVCVCGWWANNWAEQQAGFGGLSAVIWTAIRRVGVDVSPAGFAPLITNIHIPYC